MNVFNHFIHARLLLFDMVWNIVYAVPFTCFSIVRKQCNLKESMFSLSQRCKSRKSATSWSAYSRFCWSYGIWCSIRTQHESVVSNHSKFREQFMVYLCLTIRFVAVKMSIISVTIKKFQIYTDVQTTLKLSQDVW